MRKSLFLKLIKKIINKTMTNFREKVIFLSEQAIKLDPYLDTVNSKKLFWEIKDEIKEAIEVFDNDDGELEKEMWDVFWDFNILIQKLQQEWKIDIEKVYKSIYEKMSSRKPFLEKNQKVSKDEAKAMWNRAKINEWYSKDRLWVDEREWFE